MAGKQEAVVQAGFSAYSELDLFRGHAEATPVGRPWYLSRMFRGEFLEAGFQFVAADKRAALLRNGCANLAVAGSAVEVRVYVGRRHRGHRARHAYLAA